MKGFSSKTLAIRLKQLEKNEILERKAYNEIPPRVEYRLTAKGQELVESVIGLLQWMWKWSRKQTTQTGSDLRLVIHKIYALMIYTKLFNVLLLHLYRLELPVTRGA
jgi:DNA-binding PadR family transcriptional regulator